MTIQRQYSLFRRFFLSKIADFRVALSWLNCMKRLGAWMRRILLHSYRRWDFFQLFFLSKIGIFLLGFKIKIVMMTMSRVWFGYRQRQYCIFRRFLFFGFCGFLCGNKLIKLCEMTRSREWEKLCWFGHWRRLHHLRLREQRTLRLLQGISFSYFFLYKYCLLFHY